MVLNSSQVYKLFFLPQKVSSKEYSLKMAMQSAPSTSKVAAAVVVVDEDEEEYQGPLPLSKLEVRRKTFVFDLFLQVFDFFEGSFGNNQC